ncbi:AAA family ATPase [Paucibacter sp. O1-1]|nr:AAA family ATPase [Paucibacter sp. O1-1]MDA3828260.1 AAA family ATPase [Paucibacter sp. O1-1]
MQRQRLVTLTGMSGIGKTRLAQALRQALCADPSRRVVWVELAPLNKAEFVVSSIARSCGLETGADDELRGLIAALKPEALTLVLDNAEHLVESVAEVAHALLEGCSGLQLLVTSQARLKLAAEAVLPLVPLPVAPAGTPAEQAQAAAAQALFLARCEALGRRLPADQATSDQLATLCQRLDGLPLALEYAAAAMPVLGLQGILQALDERRLSLSPGRRDAPQRHRNLRALLQWSHALLGPNEQLVLRRLGVFNGGFSLELFREVVSADFEDPWTALEALSELIDRSLVVAEATEPPRYRLLETTRAYAMELLASHDEAHAINARRAEAVCRRQERIHHAALAGEMPTTNAVEQLLVEIDNTQSAWQWAMVHDATLALRLCIPLSYLLRQSAGWTESSRCFVQTARHFNESQAPELRAHWACAAGELMAMHDRSSAREWLSFAIDQYRALDDRQGLFRAMAAWANWLLQGLPDPPVWQQTLDELRALDDEDWPDAVRANGVVLAVKLDMALHGRSATRPALENALAVAACDPQTRTHLLINVMQMALQDGCADEVIAIAEPLLLALRQGPRTASLSFVLLCLVQGQLRTGQADEARGSFGEGLPIALAHELLYLWCDALAVWACSLGSFEEAAWLNGYADSGHRAHGIERNEAEAWFRRESERQSRAALSEPAQRHAYRRGERGDDASAMSLATRLLQ